MKKKEIVLDPPYLDDEERELIESIDFDQPVDELEFQKRKKELESLARHWMESHKSPTENSDG